MSIDALNQLDAINQRTVQNVFAQGANASESQSRPEGTFMGHTVTQAESPEKMLADALDELGFAADKTKDSAIKDRKQKETSEIGQRLLALYVALMQKTGKAQKMASVVDSIKQAGSRQALRDALAREFSDPTDAWAALQAALEEAKDDASIPAERKALLADYAHQFERDNGKAIRLGLRGALSGEAFPELGGMDETRDLYRQTVGEFSSVTEVYSDIKAKYGENFEKAMDFLFSAISADIDAEVPSMGKAHLESVHAKLQTVRLTQSGYRLCEDLMKRWTDVHEVKTGSLDSMKLLGEIVGLSGKNFLDKMQIQTIVAKANPPDIEHEVLFTQDLLAMVRKFPTSLFGDTNNHAIVLDAVQAAVDDVVAREDEYLASLE